jgi:hypothetical protein
VIISGLLKYSSTYTIGSCARDIKFWYSDRSYLENLKGRDHTEEDASTDGRIISE